MMRMRHLGHPVVVVCCFPWAASACSVPAGQANAASKPIGRARLCPPRPISGRERRLTCLPRGLGGGAAVASASPSPPSGSPMEAVSLPDEAAFLAFEAECRAEQGWLTRYSREGLSVWARAPPPGGDPALHRLKGRIEMPDVPAETAYDVLHDTEYRKKWDTNVIETHEIASLSDGADVGYYSWKCPKPLRNRDVVTLRSWRVLEDKSYVILNFSVKHPKYPPRKDLVRAVSILAGYLVEPTGTNSCRLTYLAQVDPKDDEEDAQGVLEIPLLEAGAQGQHKAVAAPRAEPAPHHGPLRPVSPTRLLSGEHRRERIIGSQGGEGGHQRPRELTPLQLPLCLGAFR
uniref:START domain-containing protein 10 n=1 Tax=Anolis carolinensis TaxID=28377 RepID=A0A803SL98_ANOCA